MAPRSHTNNFKPKRIKHRRKGIHSKKKHSYSKGSKYYEKRYRGQGR